jgi:hypothetical protein
MAKLFNCYRFYLKSWVKTVATEATEAQFAFG